MIACHSRALQKLAALRRHAASNSTVRSLSDAATATVGSSTEPAPVPIVWTTHRLTPDQITKVDSIFHKVLWLDMIETAILTDEINRRLGVVLTPKQQTAISRQLDRRHNAGSTSASAGPAAEEAAPVAKLVDLKLTGFDDAAKIKVIKEIRAITSLGLKEAKELVEGFPKTIQKGLKQEVADELKAKLEAVGAKVEVV